MNKYSNSINKAKMLMKNSTDTTHDQSHALSVVTTIKNIVKFYPQVDKKLLEVAGWWHDVGRKISDIGHEEISANLAAKSLEENGFSKKDQEIVKKTIMFHKWSMKPQTIEGEILRDADKLDYISVKRWEKGINNNQLGHLYPIVDLLPDLRDKLLHLDESRQLFDKRILLFMNFISSINSKNKDIIILKSEILKKRF